MDLSTIPDELESKVRIGILSALLDGEKDFNTLKEITATSGGNLSLHLSKLEKSKYIKINKIFFNKRPKTVCSLTPRGKKIFVSFINLLINNMERD